MNDNFGLKKSLNFNGKDYRVLPGAPLPTMTREEAKTLVFSMYKEDKDKVIDNFMLFMQVNPETAKEFVQETLESTPKIKRGRPSKSE